MVQSIPAGRILVDLGCGNGKYLGLDMATSPRYEIGGDFSINLLRILANRGLQGKMCPGNNHFVGVGTGTIRYGTRYLDKKFQNATLLRNEIA